MSNLVNVDPKEFGLEETKAQDIANQFKPMLDKMVELEKEFNEVLKLDVEDPQTSKIAKELRLKYVKVRTGTAEIHKQQKAFYLAAGKYIDGWKNTQIFASQGVEQQLEKIEKHVEEKEKLRLAELNKERLALVSQYEVDATHLNLGSMADDVFELYLEGLKLQYNNKKEAERKAAEEQQRREKLHDERRLLVMPYMAFLPTQYHWCNYAEVDNKEFDTLLNDLKTSKEKHDKEQEAQRIEKERLQKEAEQKQKQLDIERKERERLEAKLKANKEEADKKLREENFEAERKRKEAEKLAKAPLKKQLENWVDTFNCDEMPETLHQDSLANEILSTFWKFKSWANKEIDKL